MLTRRGMLGAAAATAGCASLGRFARAVPAAGVDRYFVFCWFDGGWDLMLGLDPRDPDVFTPERVEETGIDPAYDQLQVGDTPDPRPLATSVPGMTLGPFAGGLVRHAERLAIVRGMSMETLTHEVGRRRFLTGRVPAGLNATGSSIDTVLAAELGLDHLLPSLAVNVESYNADRAPGATALRVLGPTDLVRALAPGAVALPPTAEARITAMADDLAACETIAASPFRSGALEGQAAARAVLDADVAAVFDFAADTPEMAALRSRFGITTEDLHLPAAQAALAVTALTSGTTRVVSFCAVEASLDTHDTSWAIDHGPLLRAGFDAVALLLDELAARPYLDTGESWLDRTTVVCASEFGRAALINASGGRDHALLNACVLAGAGIRGGTMVGASTDVGMAPQAVDLVSGQLDPAGVVPRPEHIWQALLHGIGLTGDDAALGVEPLLAILDD